MNLLILGLLIFSIVSCNSWIGHSQNTFDVHKYGAKGDGRSDDTHAFESAWKDVCGSNEKSATLLVPKSTYFLGQITFQGPCKPQNVTVQIDGTLLAPKRANWGGCTKRWIHFTTICGLTITGSGVFDGQGDDWWAAESGGAPGCKGVPAAVHIERCDNLQVKGTTHINGPGFHIYVIHSHDVTISGVTINAPLNSHNTDGIDLSNSLRVNVFDSHISSGDDCIAIKGGTQFLNVQRVTCGPANHGISVGSLGGGGAKEFVQHVNVSNCMFNGGTSGVKIKTWPGGTGYVKDINFQNITVNQTDYPISIDQHYMRTPEKSQALKVSDVIFSNMHGTSKGVNTVVLDCSKIGCDNIILKDINIVSSDPKNPASSICNYAKGQTTNVISPKACLK